MSARKPDYSRGCLLTAHEWAEFNRDIVFEQPALKAYAAPLPPAELMRTVSGGGDEGIFADEGAHFWEVLSSILPRPICSYSPILDFGCGCGRLARMFKGHACKIVGCDIDQRCIDWVRVNLPFVTADLTTPNRSLPYGDNTFGLIIAISVFTHLTEESQDFMLSELKRVAKPGAWLLLTTHGARALHLAREDERINLMMGVDAPQLAHAQLEFAAGRYSFSTIPGHLYSTLQGHLTSPTYLYGITFHAACYIRSHWGRYFDILDIASAKIHAFQDVVVLRKVKKFTKAVRNCRKIIYTSFLEHFK